MKTNSFPQPSKNKMDEILAQVQKALFLKDRKKLDSLMASMDMQKLVKNPKTKLISRDLMMLDDSDDAKTDSKTDEIKKKFEEYIETMKKNLPDPLV